MVDHYRAFQPATGRPTSIKKKVRRERKTKGKINTAFKKGSGGNPNTKNISED